MEIKLRDKMIEDIYKTTPLGLKSLAGLFDISHIRVRQILLARNVKVGKKKVKKVEREMALDKVKE